MYSSGPGPLNTNGEDFSIFPATDEESLPVDFFSVLHPPAELATMVECRASTLCNEDCNSLPIFRIQFPSVMSPALKDTDFLIR